MPLTDSVCRNAKPKDKQYKLTDSAGMHLLVKTNGGCYWRMKYYFGGKEKLLALGTYPDITLAEAREKREVARKQLIVGTDPSQVRKLAKQAKAITNANTFEAVAREWHEEGVRDFV